MLQLTDMTNQAKSMCLIWWASSEKLNNNLLYVDSNTLRANERLKKLENF